MALTISEVQDQLDLNGGRNLTSDDLLNIVLSSEDDSVTYRKAFAAVTGVSTDSYIANQADIIGIKAKALGFTDEAIANFKIAWGRIDLVGGSPRSGAGSSNAGNKKQQVFNQTLLSLSGVRSGTSGLTRASRDVQYALDNRLYIDSWVKELFEDILAESPSSPGRGAIPALSVADLSLAIAAMDEPPSKPTLEDDTEFAESDYANLKQCALLSNLDGFARDIRKEWEAEAIAGYYPMSGRIINILSKNPEGVFNNIFNSQNLVKRGMLPNTLAARSTPFFEVYTVKDQVDYYVPNELLYGAEIETESPDGLAVLKDPATTNPADLDVHITLKNATITFDGGSPATARNDVKVDISYEFKSLYALEAEWEIYESQYSVDENGWTIYNNREVKDPTSPVTSSFRLQDLVAPPMSVSGIGRIFRRQYNPNYNRIKVKFGGFLNPTDYTEDTHGSVTTGDGKVIEWEDFKPTWDTFSPGYNPVELAKILNTNQQLDLAMTEHELTVKEVEDEDIYTLKVTYRGYMQSLLTSPLFDSLKTNENLRRIKREEEDIISTAEARDCTFETVTELYRLFNNYVAEISRANVGGIIGRLLEEAKIYKTSVSKQDLKDILEQRLAAGVGPMAFHKPGSKSVVIARSGAASDAENIMGDLANGWEKSELLRTTQENLNEQSTLLTTVPTDVEVFYFFFGDLVKTITDGVYKEYSSGAMHGRDGIDETLFKEDLRIIMCPFRTNSGNIISLSEVPISLEFFWSWFHEQVIKKQMTSYPIASFIRDFAEVALANMLSEVCFGPTLEPKLHFKSSFFKGRPLAKVDITYWDNLGASGPLVLKNSYLDIDALAAAGTVDLPLLKLPLLSATSSYNNYFVIFPANHNQFGVDFSFNDTTTNEELYERLVEKYTPYVPFGVSEMGFADKVDLSKTSTTGLREARYFNNSQSGLAVLANVYDATMTCNHATYSFVPGMLTYLDPVNLSKSGMSTKGAPYNGDSIAYNLGVGGFHIVTKSTLSFTELDSITADCKETVTAKWVYSGSESEVRRTDKIGNIADPADSRDCLALKTELIAKKIAARDLGTVGTGSAP